MLYRLPSGCSFVVAAACVLCLFLGVAPAQAQEEADDLPVPDNVGEYGRVGDFRVAGTSYRIFARPGEATVQVMVLGAASGLYEVGVGTDLGKLLALTGATLGGVTNENVRQIITVRLYRSQSGGGVRELIYEEEIEDVLQTPGDYPDLRDGDVLTVEVEQQSRFGWREVLSIATTAAGLLLLLDRIFGLFGNNN